MMKYLPLLFLSVLTLQFMSCEKVENSTPSVEPEDSTIIVTGSRYYINYTIDGSTTRMKNLQDNVSSSVVRDEIAPCADGNEVRMVTYFGYASDTSRNETIGFGLGNCIADDANGFTDSTYVVGSYPIETFYPDTAIGFIYYIDADSNFWSSSLTLNGTGAQASHSFVVDSVRQNFDGVAALEVQGTFSGWVYDGNGDSVLISKAEFYSRAWAW